MDLKKKHSHVLSVWEQYEKIYYIFNSNNIWVNLQYHCPRQIHYDIWNEEKWLGFIRETQIPHVRMADDYKSWKEFLAKKELTKNDEKSFESIREVVNDPQINDDAF